MKVTLRHLTRDDFTRMGVDELPYRIRGFAAERGDELLGIGGLVYLPDGTVAAFARMVDDARRYKIALHKAGLMTLGEARRLGIRRVVAMAEKGNRAAEPWLARLGFEPLVVDGQTAWVWQG